MNLINCSSDCAYQREGYCCLDFVPEIHSVAVEGCHYYKKADAAHPSVPQNETFSDEMTEHR